MRVEIPECKRCCCCIPLRNGIIVFGYLNLRCVPGVSKVTRAPGGIGGRVGNAFAMLLVLQTSIGYGNQISSIFILLTEIFIEFQENPNVAVHRGVIYFYNIWYATILFVSDVVFNIVLLFGAHMKKTGLLRAYYYYAVTTTLLCLVSFLILRTEQLYDQVSFYVVEACFVLSSLGIQVYLILLVRSELVKIRQRSRVCYVNHAAEIIVETPEQIENTDVETITLRDASK